MTSEYAKLKLKISPANFILKMLNFFTSRIFAKKKLNPNKIDAINVVPRCSLLNSQKIFNQILN